MKKLGVLAIGFIMLFTTCSTEAIEPEFKRFENIQVIDLTKTNVEVEADAMIYNPNPVSVFLTKIEIDVFVNDVEVTHISQTSETEIAKKDEFAVPLNFSFDPKDIFKDNLMGLLQSASAMFSDKKVDLHYEGFVEIKVLDHYFEIPIDYDDEIPLVEE